MNRYGAYSAGDARPDMPNGQQNVVRPAGQVGYIVCTPENVGFGGLCGVPFGTGARWLAGMGAGCNNWSGDSRDNKIRYLINFMRGSSFDPHSRSNDIFRGYARTIIGLTGTDDTGSTAGYAKMLHGIGRLVTALDADCLRAAVTATNAPHPSTPISRIPR